jgi:hypothetical protein
MKAQPGELVRVKAFGGKELIRRLVAVQRGTALICNDEEYQAAKKENREPDCVGFRVTDVIGKEPIDSE